jgi:Cu+-exporting ATPase
VAYEAALEDGPAAGRHLISLAGSLQAGSEHPLARAIHDALAEQKITFLPASSVQALPGRGIAGVVEGRTLQLISRKALVEEGECPERTTPKLHRRATELEHDGRTVSWLLESAPTRRILGVFAFGDALKPSAKAAIARLTKLGVKAVMLTGDNAGSARAAARALKLCSRSIYAESLPGDKAAIISGFKGSGQIVAMVGDGINDAPALASADLGIAMASGTDVAMHVAGIVIMRSDPALVADAIDISRRTYRKIKQGLFWAFAYNVVGLPLAALGFLNPMIAGSAMAFSSVSVVANALLLRGWKPLKLPVTNSFSRRVRLKLWQTSKASTR